MQSDEGDQADRLVAVRSSLRSGAGHRTKFIFTANEMMVLTGMTRKQVSYWAKTGLVKPITSTPSERVSKPSLSYSLQEVVRALVICELRGAGFSLQQIRQVMQNLATSGIELTQTETYLLTDGYSVYYAFSATEVVDVLRQHHQMLLMVPVHEHVAKLSSAA